MTIATSEAQEHWQSIGEIEIASQLSLSDSSYFYDEPLVLAVNPGRHKMQIRCVSPGGHRHVAAIRILKSLGELRRGTKMGEFIVDFGQVAICDRTGAERAFETLGDNGMRRYFDQLNVTELFSLVILPDTTMAIVRAGFGSGMYPVYELVDSDGQVNGVEVDCLPAE
jgi:hypothetical protein